MIRTPFALSDGDRSTALWGRLMTHFETRVATLSRQNENPALDMAETDHIRGQIKSFRELMALDKPQRIQDSRPGDDPAP